MEECLFRGVVAVLLQLGLPIERMPIFAPRFGFGHLLQGFHLYDKNLPFSALDGSISFKRQKGKRPYAPG